MRYFLKLKTFCSEGFLSLNENNITTNFCISALPCMIKLGQILRSVYSLLFYKGISEMYFCS